MYLKFTYCTLLLLCVSLYTGKLYAQIDSTYIQSFELDFAAKIYFQDKIAGFDKENEADPSKEFMYRVNSPYSLGVGASWKHWGFSFSKGLDMIRDKDKGKTKSIEFQYHNSGRKFIYDIYLQRHSGFYDEVRNDDKTYTTYPDVTITQYGGSFQYVFNNKKFSYTAAFNQNERQLKSVGSFQLGGGVYYSKVQSDSTVLFEGMAKNHQNLQLGISGGYAYTWVMGRRWFMTGSLTMGAHFGNNYPNKFFRKKIEVYPTINTRFAVGYNAPTWSVGTSAYFNRIYLFFDGKENLSMNNANIQVTFIKRFNWGNKFINNTLNKANDMVNKTQKKLKLQ